MPAAEARVVWGRDQTAQSDWWELPFDSGQCPVEKATKGSSAHSGTAVRYYCNVKEADLSLSHTSTRYGKSKHCNRHFFLETKGGMCGRGTTPQANRCWSLSCGERERQCEPVLASVVGTRRHVLPFEGSPYQLVLTRSPLTNDCDLGVSSDQSAIKLWFCLGSGMDLVDSALPATRLGW
jgi:hypothetical protein